MSNYFIRRLGSTFFVIFGVIFFTFILMHVVPGDPLKSFIGQRADKETVERLRSEMGLDKPLLLQFKIYLVNVLHGNLGRSYFTGKEVSQSLKERFPTTLTLAFWAVLIASFSGVSVGIIAAVKRYSLIDKLALTITVFGISTPVFWFAFLLMLLLAVKFKLLPVSGSGSWIYFILPALTLGLRPAAFIARVTRTNMIDVLQQDYIRTAIAKGVPYFIVVLKHALRNAMMPIITLIGLDFGSLLSGAAITEIIFGLPGIGKYAFEGIGRRDYPVVMGVVLLTAFIFVLVNLILDLLYPVLDPRVRYEQK